MEQVVTWCALATHDGAPACVYPLDDFRDHAPDDPACWCKPFMDNGVLVHNAMDRREEYEEGRLKS